MKEERARNQEHGKLNAPNLLQVPLPDNGPIPNSQLPLLVYRHVFSDADADASSYEKLFASNNWCGSWRNGIYHYHHYHSTAHEVLGVARGSARVQFGGEGGTVQEVEPGDVIVIPAGVAHKNLGASSDLLIVGAYPDGQEPDMCYGKDGERPKADQNIARVPLPKKDPVYGSNGPLLIQWSDHRR